MIIQGAVLAAVSSNKWMSFYNDPRMQDVLAEDDEVTSLGEPLVCSSFSFPCPGGGVLRDFNFPVV